MSIIEKTLLLTFFLCHIAPTGCLDPPPIPITLEEKLAGYGWDKVLLYPIAISFWSLLTQRKVWQDRDQGWFYCITLLLHPGPSLYQGKPGSFLTIHLKSLTSESDGPLPHLTFEMKLPRSVRSNGELTHLPWSCLHEFFPINDVPKGMVYVAPEHLFLVAQ